jgi:hypothetical protein
VSRGPGYLQRRVLEALARKAVGDIRIEPFSYDPEFGYVRLSGGFGALRESVSAQGRLLHQIEPGSLDSVAYKPEPSSVRRALHGLALHGYVELAYEDDDYCLYGRSASTWGGPFATRTILFARLSADLPPSKELAAIRDTDWGEHISGFAEASWELRLSRDLQDSRLRRWEYHYLALAGGLQEVRKLAPTICGDFARPWQWLYVEYLAATNQIELFR